MSEKKTGADDHAWDFRPAQPAEYPNGRSRPPSWAITSGGLVPRSLPAGQPGPNPSDLLLFTDPSDDNTLADGDLVPAERSGLLHPRFLRLTALIGALALVSGAAVALLLDDSDRQAHTRGDGTSTPLADPVLPPGSEASASSGNSVAPSPSASAGVGAAAAGTGAAPSATSSPSPSGASPAAQQHGSAPDPLPEPTTASPSTTTAAPAAPGAPASPRRRSVQSVNYPDRYWHVQDGVGHLDPVSGSSSAGTKKESSFKLVPGLADADCYSFAIDGGQYLRHRNFRLRADSDDGSALFEKDATFCPRGSTYSGAVMLESYNYPGRFVRHKEFQLRLDPYQNSGLYRADSAFRLIGAWA